MQQSAEAGPSLTAPAESWLSVSSSRDKVPSPQPDISLRLRGGGADAGDSEGSTPDGHDEQRHRQQTSGAGSTPRRKGKEVSIAPDAPEIIGTRQSLDNYRAKLAQDLGRRDIPTRTPPSALLEKMRFSPIREEAIVSPTPGSDLPTAASTESNKTVRGGMTPGFVARTPSYPFPRMATPSFFPSHLQHALGQQSGILGSTGAQFTLHDQLTSPSSPASAMTFLPSGATPYSESFDFPTPNLYELSLMLSSEPGLDAWWSSVIQIMTECYKAERITLSVPADATDIDNVPWGQKATYHAQQEDELSMGYMARGSSRVPSSADDQSDISSIKDAFQKGERPLRPGVQSRHSFTAYEEKKQSRKAQVSEATKLNPQRPGLVPRSKSYFPGADKNSPTSPHPALNQQSLEEHDAVEPGQPVPSWEATMDSSREVKGRVLPVLQGLDLEADPLIDHNGITRVIERGNVIALTRTYPYLDPDAEEKAKAQSTRPSSSTQRKQIKTTPSTKLSSLLANASAPRSKDVSKKPSSSTKSDVTNLYSVIDETAQRPLTPNYEEFEQPPPSPWSQSPAPSPAVRPDPNENPFFTDAVVDEESFNPGPSPQDYTSDQPPEAIGVDNSWTVLHIPLHHILFSKPAQGFKLSSTALRQKTNMRGKMEGISPEPSPSEEFAHKERQPPIAILSILSPLIPYPSNLRHSLQHLAAHLATSFSLCRHYSNLETVVTGLHRKRPAAVGFGAVGPDGRANANSTMFSQLNYTPSEEISLRSISGSITSPSDYSTHSRSINPSPMGTPWDAGSLGLLMERRAVGTSPSQTGGDSYFNPRSKSSGTPGEASSSAPSHRPARNARESAATPSSHHKRSGSLRQNQQEPVSTKEAGVLDPAVGSAITTGEDTPTDTPKPQPASTAPSVVGTTKEEQLREQSGEDDRKRASNEHGPGKGVYRHTKLHSYGGDFATTFQSLPPSTPLVPKPAMPSSTPNRPGTVSTAPASMPPPTDRLKGLMLDLLPVQVFVALPVNGEIVWVNSKYLSYRGQTLADLIADPWGSLHDDDRNQFMDAWTYSLRTGEPFVHTARLRRFDGAYRWHQVRAVASRDKWGVIVQFIGSYMDIHDQKVAELVSLRQQEIEVSEAKHRLLANLIPQIIFTATESDGITFANEQWLSYTGQNDEDQLGLGFMDFVHPDDMAKCRLPADCTSRASPARRRDLDTPSEFSSSTIVPKRTSATSSSTHTPTVKSPRGPLGLSRDNSSNSSSAYDSPNADLSELTRKGIIKVATDSNGRLSYTTEMRLRSKTGEYRWHLIRCVEIDGVGFGSGTSSYFGSATDINDHKLLEAKLKEAMESKGRFLSNMSHEIRTPLIGISGMVSFLQDTTLNEEQRDYTNTIQTSANSLLMIINDILDLSKVDAGMMKLNFEWFHTRSLIEDVNELVSTMAVAKRLELNYIVEENVPSWVKGDKVRIRQVLLNVIGNAIKFTAEGEVFSRCRVFSDNTSELDEHQMMLEFSVIDTGRGFSKEEAELIFKPFSQIDGSSTRQHGGSGLGLVISRQLVELHGGTMEGSAVPGRGSTFSFTAKFGLPTSADHPHFAETPPTMASIPTPSEDKAMQTMKPLFLQRTLEQPLTASPGSDIEVASPAFTSSASSDPSVRSVRTQNTARSSISSVNVGLVHFSEAAKASGQDLSQMKLEMPSGKMSPAIPPTPEATKITNAERFRPPMYSVLIICPQTYSREAVTKHIETTLPKDVPHQITAVASVTEAGKLIGGHESVTFTHIVLNLGTAEEIISLIDQIMATSRDKTSVLILSDSVQRQAVLKLASDTAHRQLLAEKRIIFVYKPIKPSRFAAIFDPARERDLSIDLNRSSAAQMVESQKQSYLDVEKRIGNKGYRILLVEDNPVNQKVLVRYLKKVGIDAEIAADGMEATERVFAHPPKYYSLILCDLHMPRKDGYQTCREIRQWEKKGSYPSVPIIALSANVMSDVQDKCVAAGFNDYITKPVDFVDLSNAMSKHF
ncbi:Uu.00g071130.m01.CDS01 [Anthostomella pinea]|uniref:histidine kinase n=1 Tax=Anthostomella pinea TaxID=933095 RepID=A0AAI8VW18_9PEZI|nr:Uu.00g071130.m01.CDS01 [Anthostomella pinea]